MELAIALDHPAYDCFYIAHAEQLGAPLLTADKKLIAKTRTSDATIIQIMGLDDYAGENGL